MLRNVFLLQDFLILFIVFLCVYVRMICLNLGAKSGVVVHA
jgi:hypothetical protein